MCKVARLWSSQTTSSNTSTFSVLTNLFLWFFSCFWSSIPTLGDCSPNGSQNNLQDLSLLPFPQYCWPYWTWPTHRPYPLNLPNLPDLPTSPSYQTQLNIFFSIPFKLKKQIIIPRCVKNTNIEVKCYKCKIYLHTNGVIMVGRERTRGCTIMYFFWFKKIWNKNKYQNTF